ncbi:type IV pilus modification protein PilV [Nitrincola sp. MINF-07-Sa-05]|uniref:type IV pilus modification protein PilV n=1 Tax=Nitrincola salilacus TaxID=3400273 RepID=UPI00391836B1
MYKTHKVNMQGLGLIEVLITLLVLSIGLLGLAGLQLNSLKNNQSAMQRSMAIMQTYTIIEAMQADTDIKDSAPRDYSSYNLTLEASDPTGSNYSNSVRRAWREEIRALLGTQATSSIDCTLGRCSITIQFDESQASQGAPEHQITTQVQL